MKEIISVFIFMILLFDCCSQDVKKKEYIGSYVEFLNKQCPENAKWVISQDTSFEVRKIILTIQNCKLNGSRTLFDSSGHILEKENFTNGSKNGKSVSYYLNGNVKNIRYYKNDIQEGKFQVFYENGNIEF